MDGTIIGFISLGFLIILQIGMFAFGYGKLTESVKNIRNNQGDMRTAINNNRLQVETLSNAIAKIEGKIALQEKKGD